MADYHYVGNASADLSMLRGEKLELHQVIAAVHRARRTMLQITQFEVDIPRLLGMRNLSSFVGEVFSASLKACTQSLFEKNPHQDGYPDLLLMDEAGKRHWAKFKDMLRDKEPFSPFATGGVEVKATCGSVPTPQVCLKRGTRKPDIGDQRVELLTGYDWKAHHRETNLLMGVFWDFVDGIPTVVAVFYGNSLQVSDWGVIVKPKEGGAEQLPFRS